MGIQIWLIFGTLLCDRSILSHLKYCDPPPICEIMHLHEPDLARSDPKVGDVTLFDWKIVRRDSPFYVVLVLHIRLLQ